MSSPAIAEAIQSLDMDARAGRAITALSGAGVPSILLKGTTLRRLLYAEGTPRPSRDIDLLVPRELLERASTALRELAFDQVEFPEMDVPSHAILWMSTAGETVVDLHWTLKGVGVSPERVWEVLSESSTALTVGGARAVALSPAGTAFHVALHAAQHAANQDSPYAMEDLARAIAQIDPSTWRLAAQVARALEATEVFALGLRLLPPGRALATELGLPLKRPVSVVLMEPGHNPYARAVDRLASAPGARGKLAFIARELVPSRKFMAVWWPPAGRGRAWLAAGYLRRVFLLLSRAWPAFSGWRRAVAESRRSRSI